MKIALTSIFLTLVIVQGYAQSESELVKKCFDGYKKAILDGRGSDAITFVDSKTVAYYEKELALALTGDSATIANLTIIDKLTVFVTRHKLPREKLFNMTGHDYFIYAVDNGMIGKNSVVATQIGEVIVEGNFARGQIMSNGKAAPLYFQFNKEANAWKVDLTSIFPMTNMALSKMLDDQGMTDVEFIFQTLEALTGKEVGSEIWKPLK